MFGFVSKAGLNRAVSKLRQLIDDAKYTLPTASASQLGGVKVGSGLTASSGTLSVSSASANAYGGIKTGYTQSGKNYPVQQGSDGKAYVNVPWTDNDTTYSPATASANGLMVAADKKKVDGLGYVKSVCLVKAGGNSPASLFGGTWEKRADTHLFLGYDIYERIA